MTTAELRSKIGESQHSDWFNTREVQLIYQTVDFNSKLVGTSAVYDFVVKEIEGFEKYGNDLPNEFKRIVNILIGVRDKIVFLVQNDNPSEGEWNRDIRNALSNDNPPKFLHDSPKTQFLLNTHKKHFASYQAAYEFICNPNLSNITNKDYLIGFLLAYDFLFKDGQALSATHENFHGKDRASAETYKSEWETQLVDYLKQAHDKVTTSSNKIDEFVKAKKDAYGDWFHQASSNFQIFNETSEKSIKKLEELYRDKLKIEAPAKYWQLRANKLRIEGYWWLGGLTACVGVAVWILVAILSKITNGSLEEVFKNTGSAIKWSVVLITLISFLAFIMRTFSKLAFSSFHLVRDAEEREQLAYVFLALQKEDSIDKTERHLIMQSLFSRADSGLLKDEGSPTMPGNILDKALAK